MKHKPSSDALDRALTDLYQADVPQAYRASWRDVVKREESSDMKSIPRLAWLRRAALPLAAAAVLLIGTAITGVIAPRTLESAPSQDYAPQVSYASKTADTAENYDDDMAAGEIAFSAPAASTSTARGIEETQGELTDDRKIVRTVTLTLSSTAFDADYAAILSLAQSAGGYASAVSMYEQQEQKRAASFELKIPADALDGFLSGLESIGRTTDRYETASDMTTQYTDTALRLQTQQDKMTRLQELLLKAETVEDLLAIETEIANTQYEIDWLQSSLLGIDRQVEYATVSVYLQEQTPVDTAAAQDLTIGERLLSGLKASLAWLGRFFENMLVFLVAAAPVLIPLTILYIAARIVVKHRKSNKQP